MIEVPVDLVLGEDHLPGLWAAAFSLCVYLAFLGQRESCLSFPSQLAPPSAMMSGCIHAAAHASRHSFV